MALILLFFLHPLKSEIHMPGFYWLHGEGEIHAIPLGYYRQEVIRLVIE